jgi:Xaa-Pro aminopeptidase
MLLNKPRAYEVMDRHGIDGLIATTQVNVYYLTGFWGALMRMRRSFFNYAVLPRAEDAPAALVMTAVELNRLQDMPTWVPNVVTYSHPVLLESRNYDTFTEEPDAGSALLWPVRKDGLSARESEWLEMSEAQAKTIRATPTYALKKAIEDAGLARAKVGTDDPRAVTWMNDMGLDGLTGVEATNIFREIRMVKSADEIAIIRDAARINEDGINAAIGALRVGAKWSEIEIAYNVEMARQGGTGVYVTPGTGGLPHGEIVPGETVMLDSLGEYKHYHGDIGRTAVVGKPSPEMVRRSKAMRAGWDTAFETIKPGVTGREMTEKVLATIEREGFPGFVIATPHSVGLEHTDHPLPIGPQLPGSMGDLVFEENMVINVDLPFHELGWGAMHLEDMILVTADGCEALTTMDTALRIIEA